MIDFVEIESSSVKVGVLLTVSGCPMRTEISDSVKSAILKLDEHLNISIEFSVMSDEQRANLRLHLKGGFERENPFTNPNNLTKVIAIASGKGGVCKSSCCPNSTGSNRWHH
jgi:ATP-binding protein involved in chromosome partitioning